MYHVETPIQSLGSPPPPKMGIQPVNLREFTGFCLSRKFPVNDAHECKGGRGMIRRDVWNCYTGTSMNLLEYEVYIMDCASKEMARFQVW